MVTLDEKRDYMKELADVAESYRGCEGDLSINGEHYTFLSRNGKKLARRKELDVRQNVMVPAPKFVAAVDAVADKLASTPTVINDEEVVPEEESEG
jgi:hypothetical protein